MIRRKSIGPICQMPGSDRSHMRFSRPFIGHPLKTLLLLSPLILGGCGQGQLGDDQPREPISGKVTWKGQPLQKGTIQFIPTGQSNISPIVTSIEEGRYQVQKAQGPVPGNYTVAITESLEVSGPDPNSMPGESVVPPKQSIPAIYNTKSSLKAEVKSGQDNTFDFDMKP